MLARTPPLAAWVLATLATTAFLFVCFGRLTYPLELDYIEGAVMDHVVRLAAGKPIYVEPSLEFVPLAYMPLFPSAASLLARCFGPELWQPRLILLTCALGIATLIFAIVRAETRRATFAVAAAGLYLGCLGIAGGHYDVARPDSMMLFLALAGLATLRFTNSTRGALLAAALFTLGFFTKQHAIWLALAALLHIALNDRRRLVPFGAALLIGCGGGFALLSWWLGPWFSFYVWDVPAHWSQVSPGRLQRYFGERLFGTLGPLAVATLGGLCLLDRPWRGRPALWTWLCGGGIATGVMATLDPGAFKHTFLPTIVAFAVAGPVLLARLVERAETAGGPLAPRVLPLAYGLLALQFLPLVYSLESQSPRRDAERVHADFVSQLEAIPGDVLVLYHGFYGWQAGKGMHFHHLAFGDVERAHGSWLERTRPNFLREVLEPLRTGKQRPTIVTDCPLEQSGALFAELAPYYRVTHHLDTALRATLLPVTGTQIAPTLVYEPIPAEPAITASPTR